MNTQQVTSLLLCLLLSSTLAHDYLRARNLSPSASRHLAETSSKQILPFQERASSPGPGQQCVYICSSTRSSPSASSSLQMIMNSTTELIGVVNNTARVAIIIDINGGLIGLFNGTSGAVVVWNMTSQSGIYIAPGQTQRGWLSSRISFEAYFRSLTSLSFFFSLGVGTRFTAQNIGNDVLRIIGYLLGSLSATIALQVQQNLKAALSFLIQIVTIVRTLFRGELKLLFKFAEQGLIRLHGDILWLVNVFQGLASFFSQVSGGLAHLIELKVQFTLAVLFGAVNGLEVLVNLLLAIVARVDLGEVLKNLLNSFEATIYLLIQLGGGVASGVTGALKIVAAILQFKNGSAQIDVIFKNILEHVACRIADGDGTVDYPVLLTGFLDVISLQNSTHSGTGSLTEFVRIVGSLVNGTLVVNGINVSKIISVIEATFETGIQLVIDILVLIGSIVNLAVSIPALILYIIQQLATTVGSLLVSAVFPELQLNVTISGNGGGYLQWILRNFTLSDLLGFILGGINNLLKGLPIIGNIYVAISNALKNATNGQVDLQTLLSARGAKSLVDAIIEFLKQIVQGRQVMTTTLPSIGISCY